MVETIVVLFTLTSLCCYALLKAEEQDGLPHGFGKALIGRPHGDLVAVAPIKGGAQPSRTSLLKKTLAFTLAVTFVGFTASVVTVGSLEGGLEYYDSQSNAGFFLVLGSAIICRKLLGFFRALFYALVGGIVLSVVFASVPWAIMMALADTMGPSNTASNIALALTLPLAIPISLYLAPVKVGFERRFSDGYSDTISVSDGSRAYRSFTKLAPHGTR